MRHWQAEDTLIEKLNITAASNALIEQSHQQLSQLNWPTAPDNSWILVRSLEIKAPAPWLARTCADHAKQTLQQAVDGRSVGAANANAVKFNTLADLLSVLIKDILNNQQHQLWYWQRWQHLFQLPKSKQIKELLVENIEHFFQVIHCLTKLGEFSKFINELDNQHCRELLQNIQRFTGYSLLTINLEDTASEVQKTQFTLIPINSYELIQWQSVYEGIKHKPETLKLLLTVIATRHYQMQLSDTPDQVFYAIQEQLEGSLTRTIAEQSSHEITVSVNEKFGSENTQHLKPDDNYITSEEAKNDTQESNYSTPQLRHKSQHAERPSQPKQHSEERLPVTTSDNKNEINLQKEKDFQTLTNQVNKAGISQEESVLNTDFETDSAGVFLLFNLMNKCESTIQELGGWSLLPSPWLWLWAAAESLHTLPDNLKHWFSVASGYDNQAQLWQGLESYESTPWIHHTAQRIELPKWVLKPALNFYRPFNLEWPLVFKQPGSVSHTKTHLDILFSNQVSEENMGIRLSGLDFNPGWVPWLGRVVTYHYPGVEW